MIDNMETDVKKRIAEVFEYHTRESGLDKVTVNLIVSECQISRQAFYYYYRDIVDVARHVLKENLKLSLSACEEAEDPQKAVKFFTQEFVKQFPIISITLNSKYRSEIELLLIREFKDFFHMIFSHENCGRNLSRKEIEFQSDIIACGMVAFAIEHCNDRNFNKVEFSNLVWNMLKRSYGE